MKFKKPKNTLEGHGKMLLGADIDQEGQPFVVCTSCNKSFSDSDLSENLSVCPFCAHYFRMNARQRLALICDDESFFELFDDYMAENRLNFPGYDKKLKNAHLESSELDSVVCGTCTIGGSQCAIFAMEPFFMMGSMGSVCGDKITSLFEYATARSLPVIGFTVSGGARMQEGIISLMQMAKTSGAVKLHSDAGGLFVCVLTDPTTGGVSASFAMCGDITVAEPGALICFAGPRVIEQTIRKKLPENFQTAEFLLERGFVDAIIPRAEQPGYLARLLKLHSKGASTQ